MQACEGVMKSFRSVNVYNNPNLSPPFALQHTTASRKTYQGPRKRHVRQQSTWWEDESSSEGTFRSEGTGETLTKISISSGTATRQVQIGQLMRSSTLRPIPVDLANPRRSFVHLCSSDANGGYAYLC